METDYISHGVTLFLLAYGRWLTAIHHIIAELPCGTILTGSLTANLAPKLHIPSHSLSIPCLSTSPIKEKNQRLCCYYNGASFRVTTDDLPLIFCWRYFLLVIYRFIPLWKTLCETSKLWPWNVLISHGLHNYIYTTLTGCFYGRWVLHHKSWPQPRISSPSSPWRQCLLVSFKNKYFKL